ncbi:MAG: hypothetical protein LQ342_002685 [Letrouitia transgressa]|nr:MAG: hypothetical protein LQ342_002685 [Letrouitia transgressa]
MSLGCSVGDIAIVGKLVWKVYRACKDHPAVFQVIAKKALATHAVVRRLEEEAKDKQSMLNQCDAKKRNELMEIIGELRTELEGVDKILAQYRQGKPIPNAFRMAKIDPKHLCADFGFYLTAITTFTDSLSRGALGRIETLLHKTVQEIREGRRADPRYNASARKELELELAKNGVSARDRARYGPAITAFLLGCLSGTSYHSLRDIALPVKSHDQKAICDEKLSCEEGISSEEETLGGEEPFSDKETSGDEKSFSDEETSSSDNSFNDRESFRNEEGSADEDAPIAKNKKLSKLVVHKAIKYAKKTLAESIFDII